MKQKLQALGAALMLCATPLFAHDFEVSGIYYNITSEEDKTVEVTFSGDSYGAVQNEYSGSVSIPETVNYNDNTYSVTSIGSSAFDECTSLTSVEIPNSVTSIGDNAFNSCYNLASVEIPNSVTSIGESAFSTCVVLTSVVIGNSVTSIGTGAFYYCSSLTSVEIPNSVTSIGESAFSFCSVLTSVEIGNSVTCIGKDAFQGCSSLTSVEIPNSVTSIGESAFSLCSALESIIVDEKNTVYDSRQGCNAIIETSSNTLVHSCQSTIIPNNVTSIGAFAFRDCSGLTSVEIPNSVTSIGDYAFYDCSDLTSVEIGNSVTYIGISAFLGCTSLTSVEIPNSVTYIGKSAFADCSSLTSVKIGNSVTRIGTFAFSDCYDLESIIVDEENTVYDSREDCNAIIKTSSNTLIAGCKSTIIPNSVTSIGDDAFYGCSGLTSVEIPNSVTNIGNNAFERCSGLTSITSYIPADKLFEIESYVFEGIDKTNCTLYVPYGAKDTYDATAGWSDFTNIVEMPASITVSSAGYATLYLDYAAEIPEGVEVYTASEIEGDRLMMDLVESDVLPANTGVLVKAPAATYTFNYTESEVPAIVDNLFSGSITAEYIDVPSNKTAFVLSLVDGNVGMYLAKLTDGQFLNNANKAYLLLSKDKLGISEDEVDTSIGGMQLSLRFDFNGSTGIDGVQTETSVQGAIYDLYGRKLQSAPTKGLYIINGKKVLVK